MARPPSLSNLSILQLQQIIQTRRGEIARLERQRAKLARKLNQLDSKIEALGGSIAIESPCEEILNESLGFVSKQWRLVFSLLSE